MGDISTVMLRLVLSTISVAALTMAVLPACSNDVPSTGTAPSEVTPTPTAVPSRSSSATQPDIALVATANTSEDAVSKESLSANNARRSQLAATFVAAGISNPSKWAREVEDYRPYFVDDTDFTKLRGELAKYNPAPGVVDSIIELLELP